MNAFHRNWAFYCIQVEEDKTCIYSLKQRNKVRINDKISIEMKLKEGFIYSFWYSLLSASLILELGF